MKPRCIYCYTILPNEMNERRIFSIDDIVKLDMPDATIPEPTHSDPITPDAATPNSTTPVATSNFSIKGFLEQNHRLFTILGIFGALSYYLTNLSSNPKVLGVCSLASNATLINTTISNTTISNTTISNTTISNVSTNSSLITPDLMLDFGTLLSYLVFVGVLAILIIETFRYDKNFQRSLFIYCFFFLGIIVIIYSISVLMTIIPYFIFISTIYFCGLLYAVIYEYIVKTTENGVISSKASLYTGLIVLVSLVFSLGLMTHLVSIIPKDGSGFQQSDILLTTYVLFLLGLLIGVFILGAPIVMTRYIFDTLTHNASKKVICIIGSLLIITGIIVAFLNFMGTVSLGVLLAFFGVVVLFSLVVEYIKVKYSLKI